MVKHKNTNCQITVIFFIWFVILFMKQPTSQAVTIEQTRWGFDGSIVSGRINMLSILLSNEYDDAFEGDLELYREILPGSRVGASLIKPCYLSPGARRWVQFYCYTGHENELWLLSWGSGLHQSFEIPRPRSGAPTRVYLADMSQPFNTLPGLKVLPENLFPISVVATDGLHSVVLDHEPHWEQPQRIAFMDWLRKGGVLNIVPNENGEFALFHGLLSEINSELHFFTIGSGIVIKHDRDRLFINEESLNQFDPLPELVKQQPLIYAYEDNILRSLTILAMPDHPWSWIYLFAVLYVLIIGPANYGLTRFTRRHVLIIGFFLTTVSLFSLFFYYIGNWGYEKSNSIHSMSYAKAIDSSSFDVTQWTNIFMSEGDYYTIKKAGQDHIFSTCQSMEQVNGIIINGKDGWFGIDIPRMSKRYFLHRTKVTNAPGHYSLHLESCSGDTTLESLHLIGSEALMIKVNKMWAFYNNSFYRLKKTGNSITLDKQAAIPLKDFFTQKDMIFSYLNQIDRTVPIDYNVYFERYVKPTIVWSLGGLYVLDNAWQVQWNDMKKLHVFLLAQSGPEFLYNQTNVNHEVGYVLFHFDFFREVRPHE